MRALVLLAVLCVGVMGCDSPPEGCHVPDPDRCDLSQVDVYAVCENRPNGATNPYLCPGGLTPDEPLSCSAPYYGIQCDWGSVGAICCD